MIKIVSNKELGTECWSPNRVMGCCHKCNKVRNCKLPAARIGRLKLLRL